MILINNISKEYFGEPLFEKVSFAIKRGDKIGLVGPNGAGKTTILKIILGQTEPDSGSVKTENEKLGYLSQELPFLPSDTVESFLEFSDSAKIKSALSKVNFNTTIRFTINGEEKNIRATEKLDPKHRVSALSGGQKTKLALAKILLQRPTILILDEPTNHLDFRGLEWLEKFVSDFKGGVLIVSHDRRFLDNTTNKILELDEVNHRFSTYAGNYTDYAMAKEKQTAKWEYEYEKQEKHKRKLEIWLALKKQEASIYDDPSKGKQIRAMKKRLEREVYAKESPKPKSEKKIKNLEFDGKSSSGKLILRLKNICKRSNNKEVLKGIDFEIRGKDHVLLKGENGSGKTTIVKIAIGLIKPDSGEVKIGENVSLGYFAQEHEVLNPQNNVEEEFLATPRLKKLNRDPRKVLGVFLFSGSDAFKKVSSLSLGERVRLIFAKLTNQQNELLILDEPTNHLDTFSREVIEDSLMEFEGAILMISHDRYFLEKIKLNRILELENGKVSEVY